MPTITLTSKRLYKNAGAHVAWWQVDAIQTDEGAHLLITFAKKEGGAITEKQVPVQGKNIGKANETSPSIQAMAEAESRWKKQLDKGYVENIEDAAKPVTNTLGTAKPMLAEKFKDVNPTSIDWENAFSQPKLDGHRSMRKGFLYSRQGKLQDVPHIEAAIAAQPSLAALHLDGELYIHSPEWSLQKLGSLIKKQQPDSLKLEYWVYDIVSDLCFEDRFKILQRAFDACTDLDVRIKLVETHKVTSLKEHMDLHKQWRVNAVKPYEGSMLRHSLQIYQDDKRSQSLIKVKDFEDSEYPVIGYELGTPNIIKGETLQVPIFVYEVKPGLTGKVTAMGNAYEKHAEYLELMEGRNMDRRMLTIEHMGFTDDGVPNIATAKCWREAV